MSLLVGMKVATGDTAMFGQEFGKPFLIKLSGRKADKVGYVESRVVQLLQSLVL